MYSGVFLPFQADGERRNVPERSMPADQDIQSRIDTTAVLPNDVMEMVEQYLQGLKLEADIKAKEFMLSLWDFAGQHLYYASHSIFLSMRAVYVLVHNLSKDLSAQAEPCARQGTLDILLENPTNQTNLDNLLSWLVSVHCIRPTTDEADDLKGNPLCLRPPVFVVGTHADKPFEGIMKMERCIKKSIKGKTYQKHVVRPFFAVDNTGSLNDYGVQSLQNKIMEVLNQEPYMGEEVPIRYGAFNNQFRCQVGPDDDGVPNLHFAHQRFPFNDGNLYGSSRIHHVEEPLTHKKHKP